MRFLDDMADDFYKKTREERAKYFKRSGYGA